MYVPLLCTVTDMEGAIKTVVMQYLSSARGKESLGAKSFQKLVQGQLGNILSVRSSVLTFDQMFLTNLSVFLVNFS